MYLCTVDLAGFLATRNMNCINVVLTSSYVMLSFSSLKIYLCVLGRYINTYW